MKPQSLVILALVAVVGYFLYKNSLQPAESTRENNTAGGDQNIAPEDTFSQILGGVTALFGAVKAVAQTTQRTT